MAIEMNTGCLQCHMNRCLETARSLGDEKTAMAFARELMKIYMEAPEGISSPYLGPASNALLKKYYPLPDRLQRLCAGTDGQHPGNGGKG